MRMIMLSIAVVLGCRDSTPKPTNAEAERAFRCGDRTAQTDSCQHYTVPLPQLLAHPLQFQGRIVETQGYAVLAAGGLSHLYPTRTERDQGLVLNSLALVFAQDSVERRLAGREGYVDVEAEYDTATRRSALPPLWAAALRVRSIRGLRDTTWGDWIDPTYMPAGVR